MSIDKLKSRFFTGAFITDVKHYFSKINEIIDWINNSVSAIGIGGSGTTNYVSKFTAAGSIGNSQIFDNGTNVGIGTISPTAMVHSKGIDATSSNYSLKVENSASTSLLSVRNDGNVGIGIAAPTAKLQIISPNDTIGIYGIKWDNLSASRQFYLDNDGSLTLVGRQHIVWANGASFTAFDIIAQTGQIFNVSGSGAGSVLIGIGAIDSSTKLLIKGVDSTASNFALKIDNSTSNPLFYVRNDGVVIANNLPTSATGLPAGAIWRNGNVLNIV